MKVTALLNLAQHVSNHQNQNDSIFCLSLDMFFLMKVSFEVDSFFSGSTLYFEEMFYSFSWSTFSYCKIWYQLASVLGITCVCSLWKLVFEVKKIGKQIGKNLANFANFISLEFSIFAWICWTWKILLSIQYKGGHKQFDTIWKAQFARPFELQKQTILLQFCPTSGKARHGLHCSRKIGKLGEI